MFKTPSSKSLLCCRKRGSTDILWAASDQCQQCQWSRCSIYRGSVDHLCECLWGVYSRSMTSDIGMDGPQIFGCLLKGCSARAWRCSSPQRAGSEFHGFHWFADLSAKSIDYMLWSCCSSCATFEYVYIATTARSTKMRLDASTAEWLLATALQHCSHSRFTVLECIHSAKAQTVKRGIEWKVAATMPDEPVEAAFPSQPLQAMSCVWKDHPTSSNYAETKSHIT